LPANRRRALRLLTPVVAMSLAACGTTVHVARGSGGTSTGGSGGASTGFAPGAVASAAGAASASGSAAATGAYSPDQQPGDEASAAVAGRAGAAARVHLGFFISDDASAIYKSLGISGASHTRAESEAIWQAIIDDVNSRGGLAGHRIVPTYSFIDSESGSNASRSQAACELFSRDRRVFAVVIDGATDISMAACLAKHHIPAIDVGQTSYPYDDVDLRALAPYLYLPGRLSMGRFATYVDALADQGFLTAGSKVGLLRFDLPDQLRTRRDVLEPALRRHGLRLAKEFAFTPIEGTQDLARGADEASAAVLQMRAAGVDRILFLGSGLSLPYIFPTVAESQGYRPRYGITTDDGPDFMATNAPAAQMTGATAVGWEPQYDVADSDAVLHGDGRWRTCAALMRKAGFTPRDGRRCTALFFLEEAMSGASSLTPGALERGAARLGATSYSTQNYGTFYARGRYDGVSVVRVLGFDAACTCFRYRSGNRRI
jgi:hypothetical protein